MNASRAEIFALWKKKIPQVFQKRSRSGDLAARLAAPQSFIYKEMRGQLFPMNLQWETRKKRITTVPVRKQPKQQSFIDRKLRKNSQQKRKTKKMKEKEREKESHEYEKKAQGLEPSDFDHHRLLDVPNWREASDSGSRHWRKCQSLSISLSLSLARKMTPTLPQNSQMRYLIKSALEPSLPLSYATNCVLMSPTPVYFYDEKTAKPQVSRSSLQCLSWLHY